MSDDEEEFARLLDASSLGAPHVVAMRAGAPLPEDVQARLDEAVRRASNVPRETSKEN